MKLYLTVALVALLFNFGAAKHVPRNLRASASDDVVVQETAAESDLLDNNVDNEALVNNEESSNSVNLLSNQPELTLVQNAPTKTLSTVSHANLVSAPTKTLTPVQTVSVQTVPVQTATLQAVPVQTATVQTAPVQTVNVLKSQTQNLVTKSAPLTTSKTVVLNQVPTQTLYTVPQTQTVKYYQQVVSAPQQQQQVVYSVQQQPQQQWVSVQAQQPQQQWVSVQAPQQQQQWVSTQAQPQQQLVSVQAQPQQQWVSTQAQPQQQQWVSTQAQPQQQNLVLLRNRQPATSGRTTNVWVDQTPLSRSSTLQLVQPAQLTKTRAPNPLVYQVQPSRQTTLSRQTVLSGAQLSSDVADESRPSDFVVQEADSSY